MEKVFWHNLSWQQVLRKLESDPERGLTEKEVKERLEKYGKNKLPEEKPLSSFEIFLEQFKSPLIYILVIAGVITLLLREYTDSIVIFGAVFLNALVGFFQEKKASQALRELKKIVKINARVIRDGNQKIIDAENLVLGDIFLLKAGDKVPADGRIIKAKNLKTNEMALTGEWLPAKKHSEILPRETPLADRDNMVFMGTIVEQGKAKAIVTATGLNTEMGKIAQMLRETKEEKTPYQRKLSHFSKFVGIAIGVICFLIFISGMLEGKPFEEMFTTSVAIAVAGIPEGLPVAMTVILAIGMQKILKRKGLVRRLVAAETLGSASIICTDKTATLTEGRMKVVKVIGEKKLILKAATLISEAFVENPQDPKEKWIIRGPPTDRAFLEAGIEAGFNKKDLEKEKIDGIPFNPQNKFSAALIKENEKNILYVCGAPERILEKSSLKIEERKKWEKETENLAKKGLRIVAAAKKEIKKIPEKLEKEVENLNFLGLIVLKDPIRPDVKEAIKICQKAGLKPIIVTGDHKLTAKAVAEELGIEVRDENIMEGRDLDRLSEREFDKILDKIQIYARVEPRHKMRIVSAFKEKGEVVAMTGDGINDAPALKKADIGVALGSGTDVAKEVSDLILLNDSFSIIVAAIEEGRGILDNIRKVTTFLLSDSFCEAILIGGSMLICWLMKRVWLLPMTAIQILWVNLIEDGPLSIALAFEPKEEGIMKRRPTGHKIHLLTSEMKVLIFVIGILTDIFLLFMFFWLLEFTHYDIWHIRSVIFAGLALDSMLYIFSIKSLRKNIWKINPFSNKFLIFAWFFGILMLFAGLYLPPLQVLLKTVPLNVFDWGLVLGFGFLNILLIELTKWYFISRHETEI